MEKLMTKPQDHMEKMVALILIAYTMDLWSGDKLCIMDPKAGQKSSPAKCSYLTLPDFFPDPVSRGFCGMDKFQQTHNQINYLEIPTRDLPATKEFFGNVFGWEIVDYGPNYISFSNEGVDGGFFKSDLTVSTNTGSVLVVLYSNNLEATQASVEASGGVIKPLHSFPGGRRFHFTDPNGNELAVWSE